MALQPARLCVYDARSLLFGLARRIPTTQTSSQRITPGPSPGDRSSGARIRPSRHASWCIMHESKRLHAQSRARPKDKTMNHVRSNLQHLLLPAHITVCALGYTFDVTSMRRRGPL